MEGTQRCLSAHRWQYFSTHNQRVPKDKKAKFAQYREHQTQKTRNVVVNWSNTSDLPTLASWLWTADDASTQLDCSSLSGPGC